MQIKATKDFPTFSGALASFLQANGVDAGNVAACCIAVAGPVSNNSVRMTNLDWSIDGGQVESEFGFRVAVRPLLTAPQFASTPSVLWLVW